jgi:dihydropyrimidinase
MPFDLLIRGGTVATAADAYAADVAVSAGRVVAVGEALGAAREEIDATGLQVLPGGIDVHTHLDAETAEGMTSADDFQSGTAAAACGGITTICDYAFQTPGQSLAQAVETWKGKATGKAHIDYGFHIAPAEATPERLAEIPDLVAAGYPSFKVFMIREWGIGEEGILRLLETARACGAMVNVHAEDGEMLRHAAERLLAQGKRDPRYYAESRPALAEAEATRRAIAYAELVGAEIYVVHVSCAAALDAIRAARGRGLRVWAETRPIYLALTDDRYRAGGVDAAKFVGAPPLRSAQDQAALWAGLRNGDLQVIASDNTAWTATQKAAGADDFTRVPYGVPGLETEMAVVYSEGVSRGRIPLTTFVSAFSTAPARIFGLYPRKGTIAVGSDADLVLFDPARTWTIDERRLHSRAGYDPFHGFQLHGAPVMTISRGEVIARQGELLSRPGRGVHLLRRRAA